MLASSSNAMGKRVQKVGLVASWLEKWSVLSNFPSDVVRLDRR